MGGSSSSDSSGASWTVHNPVYSNNPYSTVYTDANGNTTANFNEGTGFKTVYDYTNANMGDLLNEWRNPSLDTTTNQARIKAYNKTMNENALNNLENNIINPLSQRNMIRSSQATQLYKGLNDSLIDAYDNFTTDLLANSQKETGNMIDQLQNWYMQGQQALNQDIQNNLNVYNGNGVTYKTGSSEVA